MTKSVLRLKAVKIDQDQIAGPGKPIELVKLSLWDQCMMEELNEQIEKGDDNAETIDVALDPDRIQARMADALTDPQYIINFVGQSAYLVGAPDGDEKILARIDFTTVGVGVFEDSPELREAISQAFEVGQQLKRKPALDTNAVEPGQQLKIRFQGVGFFKDGRLRYHSLNQTIKVKMNEDEAEKVSLGVRKLAEFARPVPKARSRKVSAFAWDVTQGMGCDCAVYEYTLLMTGQADRTAQPLH